MCRGSRHSTILTFHPFTNATGIRVSVTDSRNETAYILLALCSLVKSRAVGSLVWYEHAHNHFSEQYFQMLCPVKNCLHRNRSVCIPIIGCVQLPVLSNYHQHSIFTYRAKFLDLILYVSVLFFLSPLLYFLGFLKSCKEGYVPIVYILDLSCLVSVSLSR